MVLVLKNILQSNAAPSTPKLGMVLELAGTNNYSSMKQNPLLQLLMWDANILVY